MNQSLVSRATGKTRAARVLLMAGALVASLAGLWAGLVRMGWQLPDTSLTLLLAHGPLMVCGTLAALVGLERAVALQKTWPYAVPALSALGVACAVAGLPLTVAALLFTVASLLLALVYAEIVNTHPALYTKVMAAGAMLLLAGNVLWVFGTPVYRIFPWWMGFLVFTIAGERLELGRVQRLSPRVTRLFEIAAVALGAGIVVAGLLPALNLNVPVLSFIGMRFFGLTLIGMALWLLRYDIARKTVKTHGLPQFVGVCLLLGHAWLLIGGALMVVIGFQASGPLYDAMLHAVFVGFVFSMIFGHAPIIVPAVMGVPVGMTRLLYLPLVLLHGSLLLRVLGDLVMNIEMRRWGGMLNAVALLGYVAVMIFAARKARQAQRAKEAQHRPAVAGLGTGQPAERQA
jgi:hypothetical protein